MKCSKHWTQAPHFLMLSWATWAPVILSDILEMPQGWLRSDNSSLAVLVWMRKLTRSRFHCSCQCGKPITLGWWETLLSALAIWVTSRYPPGLRQSDCIISLPEVPSSKKETMLYSSPKWEKLASIAVSLRNIKYLAAKFLCEHQRIEYSYRIPIKTTTTTSKRKVNKYPCTSNKGTRHAWRPAWKEEEQKCRMLLWLENSGTSVPALICSLLFAVSPRKQLCSGTDLV